MHWTKTAGGASYHVFSLTSAEEEDAQWDTIIETAQCQYKIMEEKKHLSIKFMLV